MISFREYDVNEISENIDGINQEKSQMVIKRMSKAFKKQQLQAHHHHCKTAKKGETADAEVSPPVKENYERKLPKGGSPQHRASKYYVLGTTYVLF